MRLWSRSAHGILAGVCSGIAERFQIDVVVVRVVWVASLLLAGVGLGVYIILALSLPRSDRIEHAHDARVFGVSSRFARRFDFDIGLTRAVFLFLLLGTWGTMVLLYIILYFILPTDAELGQRYTSW